MKFEFPKIVSLDILYLCLIVIKILIKTKANEPATGKSIPRQSNIYASQFQKGGPTEQVKVTK